MLGPTVRLWGYNMVIYNLYSWGNGDRYNNKSLLNNPGLWKCGGRWIGHYICLTTSLSCWRTGRQVWVPAWWSGRVPRWAWLIWIMKGLPSGYLFIFHGNNAQKENLSLLFYQNVFFFFFGTFKRNAVKAKRKYFELLKCPEKFSLGQARSKGSNGIQMAWTLSLSFIFLCFCFIPGKATSTRWSAALGFKTSYQLSNLDEREFLFPGNFDGCP